MKKLLARPDLAATVLAVVRNPAKAAQVLPLSDRLELVQCDLANDDALRKLRVTVDKAAAVIWCASSWLKLAPLSH